MEQKTKVSILIALVLLIVAGVGIYLFQKNKALLPVATQPQIVDQVAKTPESKQDEQQNILTPEKAAPNVNNQKVGTISMIDAGFITIEEIGGSLQSAITKDTKFFKREGSGKNTIKASDIKVGMNVSLKLDATTGEILEAEII